MPYIEQDDERLLEIPDEQLPFGKWIRKRWMQYYIQNNGKVSQNDFARHLGISNQNLTNYMLNNRRPSVGFIEKLADKLGPQVYDKLDLPRRMPRDKEVLYVIDSMVNFSPAERKELIEHIKNMRDRHNERRKPGELATA